VLLGDGYDLGKGWSLAVSGVNFDAADAIVETNMFNEPPESGRAFVLVDVVIAYNGTDDPKSTGFEVSIDAVANSNTSYDSFGCGVLPDDLDSLSDVFSGGAISGQACFDVEADDVSGLTLYASSGIFSGTDVFYSLSTESSQATGVATSIGPVLGAVSTPARLDPNPMNTVVPIGDGWALSVTGLGRDGTAAVLAENQFNDPPPEGYVFFLVDVILAYEGTEKQDSALAVTISAVGEGNVEYATWGCGVVPGELEVFTDVFPGASIVGTVCFVVPAAEVGSGVLLYATGEMFGDSFVTFATSRE
jgi:hypothetical protein